VTASERFEVLLGVELDHRDTLRRRLAREAVLQRMRRVGREQEHGGPRVAPREMQGGGCRARRLPDATLAAEEQQLPRIRQELRRVHVITPLP